jgi:hypothetical protein
MLDASAIWVKPSGLGRTMIVLSIVLLVLTAVVIVLRCFVRLKFAIFGLDDGLMLAGWVGLLLVSTKLTDIEVV